MQMEKQSFITTHCLRKDEGKIVSTRGIQDHLEVYMGVRLLYHFSDSGFLKNRPMKGKLWADICLPDETGEEPLCFIFEGKEKQSALCRGAHPWKLFFRCQTIICRHPYF